MRLHPLIRSSALVVAVMVALAGCGGGSEKDDTAVAFAKVSTKFGEISIPAEPKRVVALGWGDAETVLALGVEPVGASDWLAFGGEGVGPWATGRYKQAPQKIGTLEPEFEKIAALKPDLILDTKSSGDQTRYDTLKAIAPTVGVPTGGDAYKVSWEKQTELVAAALGRVDQGRQLIAATKAKVSQTVAQHPEFAGKTITLGSRTSEGYGAYVSGTGRVDFVQRLGFENNPKVEALATEGFAIKVSQEKLDLLDADLTVMAPIGVDAAKISDDPLFKAVPSVKAGHVVVFTDKTLSSAFATDSILSIGYALDKVVPLFAAALR
ncbi:iron-siderophore ABC transporter substrate-binding protein [Streptomyces sp. SID13031]|uniref:iron-siderophore ABC transporter substrate-binding protein n=1 Tax=Streptomyces sp. SID13031 TaxID=2706046 RepID=UPI0013C65DCF|nr:iron-siderophore ABC transporter substrate-binding protein [Streptomyces sp. SID13031]NEA30630.1 iron-siderophore ABC transporter substrate-binding protein [Streptomyces sp. SID13031]